MEIGSCVGVDFMLTRWANLKTFPGGNESRPYDKIRKNMRNNYDALYSFLIDTKRHLLKELTG